MLQKQLCAQKVFGPIHLERQEVTEGILSVKAMAACTFVDNSVLLK